MTGTTGQEDWPTYEIGSVSLAAAFAAAFFMSVMHSNFMSVMHSKISYKTNSLYSYLVVDAGECLCINFKHQQCLYIGDCFHSCSGLPACRAFIFTRIFIFGIEKVVL